MNNKLFVGNLSYRTSDEGLQELFGQYGEATVSIPKDRDTGRPRGFAFVEFATQAQAEAAIQALNGREFEGRQLSVSIAQPKARSSGRSRY